MARGSPAMLKVRFNGIWCDGITKPDIDLHWQASRFHETREGHSKTFIILIFFDLLYLDGVPVKANAIVLDFHVANLFEYVLIPLRTVITDRQKVGISCRTVSLFRP